MPPPPPHIKVASRSLLDQVSTLFDFRCAVLKSSRGLPAAPRRVFENLIIVSSYFLPQEERFEHIKTKAKLAGETEKLQFALGEIDILNKQLQREKNAFETA